MSMELTILGSGAAFPTLERGATSQWLQVNNDAYLIDCGEGTQRSILLRKCRTKYLRAIFISHMHGDHIFGLPGLISSMDLMGRERPLKIIGPVGLETYLESSNVLPSRYAVEIAELEPDENGCIYQDRSVSVFSQPLVHRIDCHGFRFDENKKPNIRKELVEKYQIPGEKIPNILSGQDWEGKDIVITNSELLYYKVRPVSYGYMTDTKPINTPTIFTGVDTLYHEATFTEEHVLRADETYHSTAQQAAQFAHASSVGTLLLGHLSSRYNTSVGHLNEATLLFPKTFVVSDGDVIKIEPRA